VALEFEEAAVLAGAMVEGREVGVVGRAENMPTESRSSSEKITGNA